MTTSSSKPFSWTGRLRRTADVASGTSVSPDAHAFTARERRQERRLLLVLLLIASFCGAQAVGAAWAESDALRAEALHMLADVGVLALAWVGMRLAVRRPTARLTYGLRRAEPLLAMANALLILGATVVVVREAVLDWSRSVGPRPDRMLLVAAATVAVDGVAAWLIHGAIGGMPHAGHAVPSPERDGAACADHSHLHLAHAGHDYRHGHSLNLRGAWLHMLGDALGSLSALVAALAIQLGASPKFDAAATFVVAAILVNSAGRLLRDALLVLLEASPAHLSVESVCAAILQTAGVLEVRDLHVWTLGAGHEAITAHVRAGAPDPQLAARIEQRLRRQFPIEYVTIQVDVEIGA